MQPAATLDPAAVIGAALEDLRLAREIVTGIIVDDDTSPVERARAFASLSKINKEHARLTALAGSVA